jgi:hypothetical protein
LAGRRKVGRQEKGCQPGERLPARINAVGKEMTVRQEKSYQARERLR